MLEQTEQTRLLAVQAWPDIWRQCAYDFLQQIYERSHSIGSRVEYQRVLVQFFSQCRKLPDAATQRDVRMFLDSRFDEAGPIAPRTHNKRLAILNSFYHYASGYLVSGPDGQETPLFTRHSPTSGLRAVHVPKRYRALSEEEITCLFKAIPTNTVQGLRDRAIYLLYFWSARRREEIARLRWGDLYQGTIIDEKGQRRYGWLYRFTGKGKGGEIDHAELPMPAKLAIDKYLVVSGRMATIVADDPLFVAIGPATGGGQPLSDRKPLGSQVMNCNLKRYAEKAGLDPERVSLHSWRHTAAQARYSAGEDVRSLQRLLRHASLATTDIYLQCLNATADNGSRLLEKQFAYL